MRTLILLLFALNLSGCWYYYEEQEALAYQTGYNDGYEDGQTDRDLEIEALEDEIDELQRQLDVVECERWCAEQILEVCGGE